MGFMWTYFVIASSFLAGMSIFLGMEVAGFFHLPLVLGLLVIIPEIVVAYRWNKSRKHWRGEAFDDRLTDARMHQAQQEMIEIWKKEKGEK